MTSDYSNGNKDPPQGLAMNVNVRPPPRAMTDEETLSP